MKKKTIRPMTANHAQPFVMGIADKLSDDPMLIRLIGTRFKVIVDYDTAARRVTYSFRSPDDIGSDDLDARMV